MNTQEWISQLSKPRKEFSGLPACPYAKAAQTVTVKIESITDLRTLLLAIADISIKHVVIIELPIELKEEVKTLLASLPVSSVMPLLSDPENPMVIAGHRTTQSHGLLLLLQNREELIHAREHLTKHNYYSNWTQEQLDCIEYHEASPWQLKSHLKIRHI